MAEIESNHPFLNGINTRGFSSGEIIPTQAIPNSKKTSDWYKATINAYERIGERQLQKNIRFRDYRKMTEGEFTYAATGFGEFQELPWFDKEIRKLRGDRGIPTHIKHFDFIGIVVNALAGIYSDFENTFRIDSKDEYSTNEFIRQKTELLHKYAVETFQKELNKLLLMRGFDPNKSDFQSEEEAQQYQQQLQEQSKALTPEEIEVSLSKNFKVLATEWAQNTLEEDAVEFHLNELDREEFIDVLLTGRYFRHYRVNFDSYVPERWLPEETFFSQDVDAKYPQNCEFVGRITNISPSSIIDLYGHLLSASEQEKISNYWNQNEDWKRQAGSKVGGGKSIMQKAFPELHSVPFENYYTHDLMTQMEDALGQPLGVRTFQNGDGSEIDVESWLPRMQGQTLGNSNLFAKYLRDDIEVRSDTIQVTEVYWKSRKRIGLLTYVNDTGNTAQIIVTDDLLPEYLKENEIKTIKKVSFEELRRAIDNGALDEYVNTIVYNYVPEIWRGIKIKGNGSTLKEDLFLDVRPLDYQIKGSRSNIYNFQIPVSGLISTGVAKKLEPYQVLHNICMNQITELLEKELGVFFTFDMMYLPAEYKDGTTEDSLYEMREMIKSIGIFGMDMSKQNTEGNQALVNSFQRQDISYGTQVQYRWQLATQYKQEALAQIGITPQLLGQPNTYTTSEGVKQGAQASYALLTPIFEKFNTAKLLEKDLHIAIAQYCQTNNRDSTVIYRKGDGSHYVLDIMKEDGELFPLRHLGCIATSSPKDRKVIEQIRQYFAQDNTIQRDLEDAINILTCPTLVEIKDLARQARIKTEKQLENNQNFQREETDKQIAARQEEMKAMQQFEIDKLNINNQSDERQAYISSLGKAADSNADLDTFNMYKAETNRILEESKIKANTYLQEKSIDAKTNSDVEQRKLKIQELGLKAKELELKNKALETSKFNSIVNKN